MLVVHPSSTCDVCLDPYSWATPSNTPHAIACGHVFCLSCLQLLAEPRCPLCRKAFQEDRIKKLHVDQCNALNDQAQSKDREFLYQVSLCFPEDSSDEQVNGVISEVHQWLATRSDDPCITHQALRAAVEGLHKYKLLVVESLQDKTMMRKHVRAVHELRQDNRALRAVENAAVTKCTELSEKVYEPLLNLEKLEKDYATLRSEHARYHAEITRLKHTANPLPAPPRHVPLEHFASLAAPSSARATWSAPAATSAPLYSSQRFDSTYVQRGGLPLAPACSPLNHKGHDLSLPRPLIVPGARPTEKFIPPVPVEIELGFTHHTKQTTSRRTGSSRKEMGAVTSPALGDLSPASRTGSSSEAGPSGHNSSRSTAVQVSHGDSTSTARQRQSQLSSASISGRRVDAHTPSAQLAAPAAPIRFDYRPQPLWISTPLIPQNVPNSDLTTAYPAFTEAAEQQTEPSALLSAAAAVTPNVPDSVATIYANTPSASSSHGRGSIGSASQNGAAYDGSVDHDSQISALMLNTLNIPGDDFRVTTRSEIATEFSGHFGSRPSDSGRPDVATHEATVGSILVRPEPSPASSWGTVSSRSSRSTSQSSLALGLTGLPTEPDTVPAEAQQQTQTPTYAPLTDVPPNGRSGVEYNATPRGRRVSFQDDSLWMPRQFTERRSEPPALGLSLDLGGDNVGQVIDGHHDLEQLDRSLIQLTSGRLENDQRRTPSSSSHSSSVSHSSVPSQAGGQQVWLGPRTGLPLYVSPSLDVPEADSRLSRTPASSDMVFSSWHSGGNAEVLPGSPSEGTRHRDAVYTNSRPESGPSRRPSMSQRSTASRSSSNSNRSAHGSIAPRSSELSRSRRNSAVTTNQWGDMQGNTVYGAPFSVDSRLPALSQSGLLLSFGTPSTSSAVIGTEEASEIRAPRPISSRSSSLFGSLASL